MHSQHGLHQCRSSVLAEEHHHSNPQIRRLCSSCVCTVEGQIWLLVSLGAVGLERWQEKQERLGRFFAKGLRAELDDLGDDRIDLRLLQTNSPAASQHGGQ